MTDRPPGTHIPTRLLVLGMARQDGTIVVSEVTPVAEACGQTVEQVSAELDAIVSDDPTALIGLPLIRTCQLLRAAGVVLP